MNLQLDIRLTVSQRLALTSSHPLYGDDDGAHEAREFTFGENRTKMCVEQSTHPILQNVSLLIAECFSLVSSRESNALFMSML